MGRKAMWIFVCFALYFFTADVWAALVPDTGQSKCYNATVEIPCPSSGQPFYGQDAQYNINPMMLWIADCRMVFRLLPVVIRIMAMTQ